MTNREIISYVMKAHGDQQYSDMPYIVHLAMVAGFFYDRERQAIALLHDILEDTDVTKDELQKLFGKKIADIVSILTHEEGETYFEYIDRVKQNKLAKEVKIADLKANLFTSMNFYPNENKSREKRYKKALNILEEGL